MLARHAENLFWLGRYMERAENTVRMLEVTYQASVEAHDSRPETEQWSELLEVLFLEDEIDPGLLAEIGPLLVADDANHASVVSLVRRSRENARATREWLPSELWEAVNGFLLELRTDDLARSMRLRPYEVFRRVKAWCHTVVGAAEATLPRGEVYNFVGLGRMLERGSTSSRVLSVWNRRLGGFTGRADFSEWVKLLRSMGSYESYLRVHQTSMTPNLVLEFLLRSPELPRSVLYTVTRAEGHLTFLGQGGLGQAALRSVGRLRSSVEYTESIGLAIDELARFLDSVEAGILQLARTVETDYFHAAPDASLHAYEVF